MILPRPGAPSSPLSEEARSYRSAMWLMILIAVAFFGVLVAVLAKKLPGVAGRPALLSFSVSTGFAIYLGLKGHRQALADRENATRGDLILMLVAQLGRQEDAVLQGLVAKGGPAGEAAQMILTGRREKRPGSGVQLTGGDSRA